MKYIIPKRLLYFFFGIYSFAQILLMPVFGVTWDEGSYRNIGTVTLSFLTGGRRDLKFYTDWLPHYGTLFETINVVVGQILLGMGVSFVDALHFTTVVIGLLGVVFLFLLVKRLFNERIAILSALLFMLLPRFVAHMHYNVMDIPVLTFSLGTSYFWITYLRGGRFRHALLAGICLGLALSTKLNALMIIPILMMPLPVVWRKDTFSLTGLFGLFGGSIATLYLTWPTVWKNPFLIIESLKYFLGAIPWSGTVLYFGHAYTGKELPWHYILFYSFMTTPVLLLILCVLGFFILIKQYRKNVSTVLFLLGWLVIPLLVSVRPGQIRYDGIRQYLILLPLIAVFAGIGLDRVLDMVGNRFAKLKKETYTVVLLIIFGGMLLQLLSVFPYGDSYYNEIVQAVYPAHLEEKFEIEYWGEAYREGVDWMNQNAVPGSTICVPLADHLIIYYPVRSDLQWSCKNPGYLMFITRYTYFRNKEIEQIQKNARPVFTVSRLNSDLLSVYQLR